MARNFTTDKNAINTGRNTTAITNPKTKSQNTNANTGAFAASPKTAAAQKEAMRKASVEQANQKNAQKQSKQNADKQQGKSAQKAMAKASDCKWEVSAENCNLTDMDIISDVLATQKTIIGMYGKAICEVDCQNLRSLISTQMSECATDQFDSFLYMNQRGMYPTEDAPAPKVNQMKKKYTSYAKGIKK